MYHRFSFSILVKLTCVLLMVLACLICFIPKWASAATSGGSVVGWGRDDQGQRDAPEPNSDFIAVSAGNYFSIGLKSTGVIVAWGYNVDNECDVPAPNTDFVAISAGSYHSLGLKSDGSVIAWGYTGDNRCTVPEPNSDFMAVAAGYSHSLGLKSNGSVVAWGTNTYQECTVPTPNTDFIAISAGYQFSLGLKEDGSVVAWGKHDYNQCTIPAPNANFEAISAGATHSLGLKSNGVIVGWGTSNPDAITVPEPNSDFVAVSAGTNHSLALKENGSVVAWGANSDGQTTVPAPNAGFASIAAGSAENSLGLKGNLVNASISNGYGTVDPPLQIAIPGEEATINIYPDTGYHIASIADNNISRPTTNPFVINNVVEDHNVVVTFVINTNNITASADTNGSISPSGVVSVNYGASQVFAITPNEDYHVADVKVDGISVGAVTTYTFTNVTAAHTITATFKSDLDTWYLAEGSTDWGFDCYISIANPNPTAVNVELTYMTSSGPVEGPTAKMPAMSQSTVNPSTTLGAKDFSTKVECIEGKAISVDRTMYWTGPTSSVSEAHCATGVTAPATTWYMPEGCSSYGFECFLLIQNPNDTQANCRITWMIQGETPVTTDVGVTANSRATFNMYDFIGARDSSIMVTSDKPVIPERAMYRNERREGHDSGGTTTATNDYYLAEGCTGFGFTTWVLVQNPNNTEAEITVTYQAASGPITGPVFTMAANSRQSINVNETTAIPGDDPSFSTHVHGSQPIIAERAMYWNGGDDGAEVCHDSIGLDTPHAIWYLADGQSSDGHETYTLVQNPNDTAMEVEITYLTPNGTSNVTKTETIPASSRRSFNMLEHSGITGRAAIMVRSTTAWKKILVERAMYWNNRGSGTDTLGGYSY